MGMETLVLLRHGESVKNVLCQNFDRFYKNDEERKKIGISEDCLIPLTKEGRRQAVETGKALKSNFGIFDLVVHSGYVRAAATTEEVLKAYTPEEKARMWTEESFLIRERDYGPCADMTVEEIERFFPWFLDYRKSAEPFTMVPPCGESIIEMCSGRLLIFLNQLQAMTAGIPYAKVLVVSHLNAIRGLRYLIERWSYEKMNEMMKNERVLSCAVNAYRFDALGQFILQFQNQAFWRPE